MKETRFRSLLKGVTWRVIASTTTMTLVYFFTGDLVMVASVGIVDVTAKIFFYYMHERFWGSVSWGTVGRTPGRR
jgi:adenylylsulfate kinase